MMRNLFALSIILVGCSTTCFGQPTCVDQRLTISLFAEAPNIVQPVSTVFDSKGRLLVIENHTHFRPDDYDGPANDRILAIEDKDKDGKADSFEVFYDGQSDSMDLALHADGSIYLATRRAIFRLTDNDDDGRAEKTEQLIELETDGDYPHNGLSGLVFDAEGNLQFGFGENLGKSYSLTGSDGKTLTGEAEGGSTYRCSAKGENLRRVATGFWNPFGQCMDAYGNIFAVDNDPDAAPPCRLLHVTDGANFGYQFKYGRPGTHPLQTWTGELPGTISMIAGTGEAPCEIIHYAQKGLPKDYLGDLLVASWGDHRIERYRLKRKGASFEATRTIIVQGDTSFWPVGIAVAPDGSLYITDWGSRSYPLHGEGKVWHLATKSGATDSVDASERWNTEDFSEIAAIRSMDASKLDELRTLVAESKSDEVQAIAVRMIGTLGGSTAAFCGPEYSAVVRNEGLRFLIEADANAMAAGLESDDAVLRASAVAALMRNRTKLDRNWFSAEYLKSPPANESPLRSTGVALACELSNADDLKSLLPAMLQSTNDDIRVVAARWAADRSLKQFLPELAHSINDAPNNLRALLALIASKRHLEGGTLDNEVLAKAIESIVVDPNASVKAKATALNAAKTNSLSLETIAIALKSKEDSLVRAATYLLMGDPDPHAQQLLRVVVENDDTSSDLRADALVALSKTASDTELLLKYGRHDSDVLRRTSMRLLTGATLQQPERTAFLKTTQSFTDQASEEFKIARRVLGNPTFAKKTIKGCLDKSASKTGDVDRGRRLFHNTRVVQCSNCHVVSNRGADIGPQLTGIAKTTTKEQLLESIIHPSARIAPQYQPWIIVGKDGRAQTGYHFASVRLVETFVDANGKQFKVAQDEIEQRVASDTSIMPEGLIDHLTKQELADLLAFLAE